jgi:methyltransferase (TIGR00027 family)
LLRGETRFSVRWGAVKCGFTAFGRGGGRGVRQYVILGAELDSFGRRSHLARRVRVFEVDHPATQEWKRRLGQAHAGVIFVPVDFTVDSLGERLGQAGFDFTEPAFVSWLGVTMYLDEAAIGRTLSVVGGFAAGTELVVDYMLPAGLRDAEGSLYADLVGRASAERGEPWLSLFGPDDMAALLSRHGFGPVRDVGQRDMIPRGGLGPVRRAAPD